MNPLIALPELVLILGALVLLLLGVLSGRNALCAWLAMGVLAACGAAAASMPHGVGFGGLIVMDRYAGFAIALILAGALFALLLSLDHNRREGIDRFEFPVLVLFSTAGMAMMVQAANLMTLYLGVELQSVAVYVLAAFARDELRSSEAGLKYFVLGSLASGLLLYGISMTYGVTGRMDFPGIVAATGPASFGLVVGLVFVLAGLAFKLSAAPFHMWSPDVYQGAPTPVTAFMSTAPKMAAIGLLLRVLLGPFGHLFGEWRQVVILLSLASMILGSFAAIGQRDIKRLMAYSSIGHVGYALVGLAAGAEAGVRGVLIYLVTYIGTSVAGFACIVAMRRQGRAVEDIADLRGLSRTDPLMALVLAVVMFSMAGFPPFSGFFGKLFVFRAAVDSGLWTLAVVGVLTSVVGAFYYLRIIKVMYVDESAPAFDRRPWTVSLAGGLGGLFTVSFLVFAGPVIGAAGRAARTLLG